MKKIVLSLLVVASLAACNNAGTDAGNTKDSLDSIANAKKDKIDSSAEQRKDMIDSTTDKQKAAVEKIDSMNKHKDSATH